MATHTYNPNSVVVAVNGTPIGQYQKDVFVEISYTEDEVTMRNTVQGDTVYSVNRANSATVTLTVEPNSNAHALLSAFYKLQKTQGGGAFPFSIVDNNVPDGISFFNCPQARLARMPNQSWGHEAQPIEYSILCGECEHFISAIPSASALPIV
jgi:hypothetical protein